MERMVILTLAASPVARIDRPILAQIASSHSDRCAQLHSMPSTGPSGRAPIGGLAHPSGYAVGAAVGLVLSYLVARQDPVPNWELNLTEWINEVPEVFATVLYPVMQLGTLFGPVLVAVAIVVLRRDWLLGGATVVAGLIAWFAAKGVKRMVERDRPLGYLPEIIVREGDGSGLGYVSGHSAVAASAAVMAMAALPARWRPPLAVGAVLVGLARIVHGVHLPADLVGGWSLGVLISLGALWSVDRINPIDRIGGAATDDSTSTEVS
jgi:undecaprenyl-diphosphatase